MVVNNRDERSQQLHHLLKERLMNITLYAQDLSQPDVWQAVNVEKDDILVYDRVHCNLNSVRNPQMRIHQQRENSIISTNITVIMDMVTKGINPTAWRGTGIILTITTITTTANNRLIWVSRS
uniref:Selenoprotein P N-terminal domain-containing protein n=1 Tax=Cyprinus carpio carpio TaxID=630221 RepID=A0A9J7Z2C2_CYPCA